MEREELVKSGLEVVDALIHYLSKDAVGGEFMSEYAASREKQAQGSREQEQMLQKMAASSAGMQEKTRAIFDNASQNIDRLAGIYHSIEKLRNDVATIEVEHKRYAEQFKELISQTAAITSLANDIQGISEQTNLLSFNASIEAAHAGSAGAGFRIIANEVKKLSADIKQTTERILGNVNKLKDSISEIEKGTLRNAQSLSGLSGEADSTLQDFDNMRQLNNANNDGVKRVSEDIGNNAAFLDSVIDTVHKAEKINEGTVNLFTNCASKNQMLFNDLYSFAYELKAILRDL